MVFMMFCDNEVIHKRLADGSEELPISFMGSATGCGRYPRSSLILITES